MTVQPRCLIVVGVLALQGGFAEHLDLLRRAAQILQLESRFKAIEVRAPDELASCNALIIPGGESTSMAFVAQQSGLLEPLRDFVKRQKKPVWGTCAGLILLSDQANATKQGGQQLIGGLGVRVHRNHFGRQIESFQTPLDLPFLSPSPKEPPEPFSGIFIRAPVVEQVLDPGVVVLAKVPGRVHKARPGVSQATTESDSGDIVAVRQGNVLGTSFHPELTTDARIHVWWLQEMLHL
ncbi:hypothetical protein CDD82_1299 [Ophiocordyceps australis]|uniref:glutaminase n=1 Tax=Ophiocordyceps australis TaxID=1399860 RepID=A0A2C5XNV3_9HYPO|nr:hypothetical protein CDD82_1299 [Ophiocordyceps australis]